MFVVSVKSDKLKKIALGAALVFAAVIVAAVMMTQLRSRPASNSDGVTLRAGTSAERVAFFSQFGWSIDEDPVEVAEVLIPAEFDETYLKYNELQKVQNKLDLSKYAGKRAKRWTYEVKNFPGYENTTGIIRANILVYEDMVIGGDICSVELEGFMQGFEKSTETPVPTSQTPAA